MLSHILNFLFSLLILNIIYCFFLCILDIFFFFYNVFNKKKKNDSVFKEGFNDDSNKNDKNKKKIILIILICLLILFIIFFIFFKSTLLFFLHSILAIFVVYCFLGCVYDVFYFSHKLFLYCKDKLVTFNKKKRNDSVCEDVVHIDKNNNKDKNKRKIFLIIFICLLILFIIFFIFFKSTLLFFLHRILAIFIVYCFLGCIYDVFYFSHKLFLYCKNKLVIFIKKKKNDSVCAAVANTDKNNNKDNKKRMAVFIIFILFLTIFFVFFKSLVLLCIPYILVIFVVYCFLGCIYDVFYFSYKLFVYCKNKLVNFIKKRKKNGDKDC